MASIVSFNSDQLDSLRSICDDFGGPTSTGYVLDVLERCVYALGAQPNLDPNPFGEQELNQEFDVCMVALDFYRVLCELEKSKKHSYDSKPITKKG